MATVQQFGIFGAGLGTATQGVYHLLGDRQQIGWQEGGLGKLAVELGVPGLIAALLLATALLRMLWRIAGQPDYPNTSQLVRTMLFALVVANLANFTASAQAYSDPGLTLISASIVGMLLSTVRYDEPFSVPPVAALTSSPSPA